MGAFSRRVIIAANGVNENVLTGSPFEFVGGPSTVIVALAQEVPATTEDVRADITFGSEVELQDGRIPVEAGVGQGPRLPDNVLVRDVARGGDRIQVRLREVGGAASEVSVIVQVDPL